MNSQQIQALKTIADDAARATQASDAGVVVSYQQGEFIVWAMNREGRIYDHRLAAECTDLQRLTAHVAGFVSNHRALWA